MEHCQAPEALQCEGHRQMTADLTHTKKKNVVFALDDDEMCYKLAFCVLGRVHIHNIPDKQL